MTDEYKYPQDLVDFITDQEAGGNEIFCTQSCDSVVWIIPQSDLGEWVVFVSWEVHTQEWTVMNITGKSYKRLIRVMEEVSSGEEVL